MIPARSWVALLVALGGCGSGYGLREADLGRPSPRRGPERRGSLVEGPFQVTFPPTRRATARRLARDAVAFVRWVHARMRSRLGPLALPPGRIRLHLFWSKDDFARYAKARGLDPKYAGGYFYQERLCLRPDKDGKGPRLWQPKQPLTVGVPEIVAVLMDQPGRDVRRIRHELTHLMTERGDGRCGSKLPVWLREALAVYLARADWARPGQPAPLPGWVRRVLERTARPPVRDVYFMGDLALHRQGNWRHYAHATLLLDLLLRTHPEATWRFTREALDGQDGGMADLSDLFGGDDKLEAAWRQRWISVVCDGAGAGGPRCSKRRPSSPRSPARPDASSDR